MATALPEHPDLDQLRTQARELQRAVRAGDPQALGRAGLAGADDAFPLSRAQLALARHYGFASWGRLRRHVEVIAARSWRRPAASAAETPADRFVRAACLTFDDGDDAAAVGRWQPADPQLAAADLAVADLAVADLAVAAAGADHAALRGLITAGADPQRPTGVFGWPPLMYATYSRVRAARADWLGTVRALLEGGADPNDGRFFRGLPTPFTALTGALGGGEGDQPPHQHAIPVARLLLEAGADANDGQALYNRMFGADDDFLELLFEYGLGTGDGGPWRRLLPDLLPGPTVLVRGLLAWAVTHDQRERVRLLARHGVDVTSPIDDGPGVPLAHGRTPIELARRNGHRELAAQLRELGAAEAELSPVDAFVAAALAGDAQGVGAAPPDVVVAARRARPGLVVWAAAQDRADAVELLVGAGFDVNAYGRSDVPVEQEWETALHAAVARGNSALVRSLLALGADPALRDTRFGGTAADWAGYFGHPEVAAVLGG